MTAPGFSEARREAIRLLLGLAGGTGSGKTYSALRLARGIAGEARFGLIDTENGRALQYADEFAFDHYPLEPPFTPARYLEAIRAGSEYPVLVVDSASHEWAGIGGVLDMADAELERMGGREAAKMASWIKPKAEHKAFVHDGLLRLPCHVILCFRAEPKVEMRKDSRGKWEVVPKASLTGLDGWIPISEKNLPFEMTASFLLMADAPGIPRPIKLPGALKPHVPLDAELAESVGAALAAWAAGEKTPAPSGVHPSPDATNGTQTGEPELLSDDQRNVLDALLRGIEPEALPMHRIWRAVAESRGEAPEAMLERLGGILQWEPLRDSLTAAEATALEARLSDYAGKVSS